jgi:hypothetical protein
MTQPGPQSRAVLHRDLHRSPKATNTHAIPEANAGNARAHRAGHGTDEGLASRGPDRGVLTSAPVLRTLAVVLAVAPVAAQAAYANPAGFSPAAGHRGVTEEVHVDVDYEYDIDSALITREHVGDPGADPLAPLARQRQLSFHQRRQLLTPKIELGLFAGFWVSFGVPIVLGHSRELDVADGVDRATATTFTDGILPADGYDARNPGTPPSGNQVFRSVNRAGVPALRGGIGFAPMNQALDDTKPTWKLGAEGRFAIGRVMRFDSVDPARQTGVSTGVHELRLWTSVDRRYRYFEGWFEAFWQLPLYSRSTALFKDPGFGAAHADLGQTAGVSFGLETFLVNNPTSGNRLSLDLGARFTAHFEGRDYSELWEAFALAGDPRASGPLVLDGDPTTDGPQALAHPGITNVESYLETGARIALRGKLGTHVTFAAFGDLIWKTDHVISFADAGVDLPTCPATPQCEDDANDLVNPRTREVNPLSSPRVDLVGHRYHAEDSRGFVLGGQLQLLF